VKWLAAAAGVVAAGGLSLLFFAPGERAAQQVAAPRVATPAPPARPAPRIAAAAAPREQSLTGVTVHGVLLRGARSQAILSVDGQPQQAYGIGDIVKPGWSVRAIGDQQVVLANGSDSTTLGVATAVPPPNAQPAATPVVAANAAPRLPGFVAGAATPMDDAAASVRNRRFLNAVQAKLRASQ
jgi:hypothetical protein